jgi:superfamily II DNA helicase RecQ
LWSLVFDREDRILVAKTGYGESVVPQLLPLLTRSSIVIVLLPLNALGAEQLADIQRLPLAKLIWLSSKNDNAATLRRIRAGIFTHVLVSLEIACSLRFYENVLSDARFRRQTKAIVIDEVHLVVDWGQSFQKPYRLLKHFRNRLGCKRSAALQPWIRLLLTNSASIRALRGRCILRGRVSTGLKSLLLESKFLPIRSQSSHTFSS